MNKSYKDRRINWTGYLGIFLILFLSAGFTSTNDIFPDFLTKALWIILIFVLAIKSRLRCNKMQLYVTMIVCVVVVINTIINNDNLINALMYCFGFLSVLFLVSTVNKVELMKSYTDVMYHLCVISLICWSIFWLVPGIRSNFLVTNAAGNVYSDILIFSFNNVVNGIPRNQGMFWEPGAFSTFIVLALLFETLNRELERKRLIIFLFTLLSTFSTTGYFAALLYICFLFLKYGYNEKERIFLVALISVIGGAIAFMWGFLIAGGTYSVFGKLVDFMNSDNYGNTVSSVSIRIDSIIKPIGVFFQYPIFGCGIQKLRALLWYDTRGMNTCTFVNWFAVYGVFFGIIMLCGIIKVSNSIASKMLLRCMVIILLLMGIMTENFTNSPVIFMVALMGYGLKAQPQNEIIV